jgi:hypothetical protein
MTSRLLYGKERGFTRELNDSLRWWLHANGVDAQYPTGTKAAERRQDHAQVLGDMEGLAIHGPNVDP